VTLDFAMHNCFYHKSTICKMILKTNQSDSEKEMFVNSVINHNTCSSSLHYT